MNYEESIAYLEAAASFGIKPGLERIEAILERLDHPEKAYKVIHVTGTNGKGSVVAMITSVLENATLKVGRYISRISSITPSASTSQAMIFRRKTSRRLQPSSAKPQKKPSLTASKLRRNLNS